MYGDYRRTSSRLSFLRQLRRRLAIAIHRPIGQSLQLTTGSLIGSSRMSTQLKKRLLWHDFWIWHRGAGAAYVCKPHSARPTMTHDRHRRYPGARCLLPDLRMRTRKCVQFACTQICHRTNKQQRTQQTKPIKDQLFCLCSASEMADRTIAAGIYRFKQPILELELCRRSVKQSLTVSAILMGAVRRKSSIVNQPSLIRHNFGFQIKNMFAEDFDQSFIRCTDLHICF